jgi:hypothetical protein
MFLSAGFARLSPLVLLAALFAFATGPAALAQKVPPPPLDSSSNSANPANPASPFPNGPGADPAREHMMHGMVRARNEERQKEIIDDTQHLLDLAKQLQDDVAKSNKNELSLSVVNTAAEIEKLAKTVKEKMRDGD